MNRPSQHLCAEAAVWVARLHSSDRSIADEEGLRKWLAANPESREAFELATRAWELAGAITPQALPRLAHVHLASGRPSKRLSLSRPGWSLAVACSVVITAAILWIGQSRDVVSTAVGEQRTLTLQDGSRVALNTDTRLSVHFEKSRRLVEISSGEALFEVAKNPDWPFIVRAGNVEVRAVGTQFVVRRDEHRLAVTLMEGKVQVSEMPKGSSGDRSFDRLPEPTVLIPGQRLVLADREKPSVDKPVIDDVTAWRRGDIVLDKTPLLAAAAEMNRYSELQIVVEGNAAEGIPLSGVFRAGDAVQFARAVAATYGLQLSSEPSRLVLSGPPKN